MGKRKEERRRDRKHKVIYVTVDETSDPGRNNDPYVLVGSIVNDVESFEDSPDDSKPHPFMILGFDGGRLFGFKMTSKMWHENNVRYYKIKNLKGTGLTKPTLIDLEYVHPSDVDLLKYLGILDKSDRKALKAQLRRYFKLRNNEFQFKRRY